MAAAQGEEHAARVAIVGLIAANTGADIATRLSPQPDRFDVYAAGLILMQLAVPMIRSDRGLKTFSDGLRQCKYNLSKWRKVGHSRAAASGAVGTMAVRLCFMTD